MKSPEYVAVVVKAYHSVLEAIYGHKKVDVEPLVQELKSLTAGLPRGHLFGEKGSKLMSLASSAIRGIIWVKSKIIIKNREETQTGGRFTPNDEIQIRRKAEIIGGRVERLEHHGKK